MWKSVEHFAVLRSRFRKFSQANGVGAFLAICCALFNQSNQSNRKFILHTDKKVQHIQRELMLERGSAKRIIHFPNS